jgi:formiminotetrahydrofolate cyclodeaminase
MTKDISNNVLASLSLQEFLEMTNQERPEITGGCVLLTGATLTTGMILMAFSISYKKTPMGTEKRTLKRLIRNINKVQASLFHAASRDLAIFNEYRAALKSRSKNKSSKLRAALVRATDSLSAAGLVLTAVIDETRKGLPYADAGVVCDVEAGLLVLEASQKGIRVLADSNQELLDRTADS